MKASEVERSASQGAGAIENHILKILRVAGQLPAGPLRNEALTEVTRLRQQAIELHRQTAADLKAQLTARRPR